MLKIDHVVVGSRQNFICSIGRRFLSLKSKSLLGSSNAAVSVQPTSPARTRFAPSPTGFIHLGSLRTALYNYLLARSTGGQFLLRLEDTDQKRLVSGAEENIYKSLQWAGLQWDEGPLVGGPHGPYRQSERGDIYKMYVSQLLESGKAYRCFCSKDRLNGLSASARQLYPPSLASYDRKCHIHVTREESDARAASGEPFTIRLIAPKQYPVVTDLLHGDQNLQVQVNYSDVRYDDPVLVKSDGLPTYHFANVIDDHLMEITHVIRGEEWLSSTPKHVYLYEALGWTAPKFVHIPLLTSSKDKKLSKRSGDASILAMAERESLLPEALVNFVALFGWSPDRHDSIGKSVSEVFTLEDLERVFSLDGLTKGNAKVDDKKLHYFNAHFFREKLGSEEYVAQTLEKIMKEAPKRFPNESDIPSDRRLSSEFSSSLLHLYSKSITSLADYFNKAAPFYSIPTLPEVAPAGKYDGEILESAIKLTPDDIDLDSATKICEALTSEKPKKLVFPTLRLALTGNSPGLTIPQIMTQLGGRVSRERFTTAYRKYSGM